MLTALPGSAGAQAPPAAGLDARVRVSHTDPCCASPQVGTLLSVTADSVVVRTGGGQRAAVVALPPRAVSSMEVGFDAGDHMGRGAATGALAGAAIGVGVVLVQDCESDESCESLHPAIAAAVGGIYGLAGLVIGGIIGGLVPRVQWVPVPIPERAGLAPTRDGGLAVRLTLRL